MQMIKFGVLLLKKPNYNATVKEKIFLLAVAFALFVFSACKSAPSAPDVDILDLVDSSSPLLIYFPVKSNEEFLKYAFSTIAALEESSAEKIVNRTDYVVLAVPAEKKNFQIAMRGTYPAIGIKSALSEKKGFLKNTCKETTFPYSYYENQQNALQISSPDSNTICVSSTVSPLLVNYENQVNKILDSTQTSQDNKKEDAFRSLDEKIYKYLTENESGEIRFYSTSPTSFISYFLGKVTNLGLNSLMGTLSNSKKENTFALRLELELSNPATAKAVCAMLKLALFPVPAKIVQTTSSKIVITDISLTWNKLIKLIEIG